MKERIEVQKSKNKIKNESKIDERKDVMIEEKIKGWK